MKIKHSNKKFGKFLRQCFQTIRDLPESKLLLLLAFVVGLGIGIAAVILKQIIHFIEHLLTGWVGESSVNGLLFLVLPGIGMLIALLFVKYVIKQDIGHGVTKVLLAVSKNKSEIKSHNTWSSVAASSLTISFGGSVGAEAPIVYTGAAIGSNIAQAMGLSYKHMTILLGCGAAGAVAGIFKAPMAGILFTLEILLFNISMTSILPLLVSSVTAATISHLLLGSDVSFTHSTLPFELNNIPYYLLLGIFCGFVSLYFTRTTIALEDRIKKVLNPYKRWAISAILLGGLIYLFPPLYGEGYVGLNYLLNGTPMEAAGPTIFASLFEYKWFIPIFFAFVLIFKVFTMSFTNAGGGVGGTFGPTLIVGGFAGFILSRVVNLTGFIELPEANFALVGMAGLMAGVMQAPMTAIFLIAEITGGYSLLMPLIITSAISFATIRSFEPYSIYTKRIAKNGDLLTHDTDQAVLTLLKTSDVVEKNFETIGIDDNLGDLISRIIKTNRNIFPVIDVNNHFKGIVYLDDIREIMFDRQLYKTTFISSIYKKAPDVVNVNDRMELVMEKFEETSAWNLPVVDDQGRYVGFVSKSKIFSSYREQLKEVSHD